jgi:hypothetical protein
MVPPPGDEVPAYAHSFLYDVPILRDEWSTLHQPIMHRRVVLGHNLSRLYLFRPDYKGVVYEAADMITIPFTTHGYEALATIPADHPILEVFAFILNTQDGAYRGRFRLERRNDLYKFVLHRIPDILFGVDTYTDESQEASTIADEPTIAVQCAAPTNPRKRASFPLYLQEFMARARKAKTCDSSVDVTDTELPTAEQPASTTAEQPASTTTEQPASTSTPTPIAHQPRTAATVQPEPLQDTPEPKGEPRKTMTHVRNYRFGIQTWFRGVKYRSRLEARFAMAMHEMEIPFVYECMTFTRPSGGTYTPDFFLPRQQLWIELKPHRPHLEEEMKCEEMSTTGFRVVLMYGENVKALPFSSEKDAVARTGARTYEHRDALRGMAWINGDKLAGETVFVVGANPRGNSVMQMMGSIDVPHLDQIVRSSDRRWDNHQISQALFVAGTHKFEE